MCKFVCELSLGDWDGDSSASHRDFRQIKIVSAFSCFVSHAPEIAGDCEARIPGLSKSFQLRVMAVTLGCPE